MSDINQTINNPYEDGEADRIAVDFNEEGFVKISHERTSS